MQSSFYHEMYFESFIQGGRTDEAVIFVHGYPGRREDKNRDLVNPNAPYDTYLPHHVGLGKSKGHFSFSESVKNFHSFYQFILMKGYKKIHLVAHSWGGFITLAILNDILKTSGSIVLYSPFLKIPEGKELDELTTAIYQSSLPYLSHVDVQDVLADLKKLSGQHNFLEFKKRLKAYSGKLKIIQAKNDVETPANLACELLAGISHIEYVELETDHSFDNCREELKTLISEYLK